jgi:hypothetical protein
MVADYALMVRNLLAFYDFTGKTMVSIGAGGGQFVRYGHAPRKIVAIDRVSPANWHGRLLIKSLGSIASQVLLCLYPLAIARGCSRQG